MIRFFVLATLLFTPTITLSQCLCGTYEFDIELQEVEFNNQVSNYSITIVKDSTTIIFKNKLLGESDLKDNQLHLDIATGGGINTLQILIQRIDTPQTMQITTLHMGYDNPYHLDIATFTPGNYTFDWSKISKCQRNHIGDQIIDCNGMKFIQLKPELYGIGQFIHNDIRPIDMASFSQ